MLPELRIYTTRDDIKYVLVEQEEVISNYLKQDGVWGSHYLHLCDSILAKSEPGRVIDIGAGLGSWTVPLAIKHSGCHSFDSFEPLPKINLQLSANILLNNLDNVNVYRVALSNKEDRAVRAAALDFHFSANHGAYSFNSDFDSVRGIAKSDKEDVYEFRTLDSYRFADVRLIKVTTPGMEKDVFEGMSQTLELSNYPPVLFESWTAEWYKENRDNAIKFFNGRGYEHFTILGIDHVIAFKTKAQADSFANDVKEVLIGSSESKNETATGGFKVSVQEHDREHVIKHQVGATSL